MPDIYINFKICIIKISIFILQICLDVCLKN